MRLISIRSIIVIAAMTLAPIASFAADDSNKLNEVFKNACVKAWMERSDKTSDKVTFKNFGEKYCDCAAGKPLDTDANIDKAARLCMSQLVLKDSIDNLESEKGLSSLTADTFKTSCADEWNVLYPDMDAGMKDGTSSYCSCAAPKIETLNQDRDKLTDKEWYAKIDGIAEECSTAVKADKGTVDSKKSQ